VLYQVGFGWLPEERIRSRLDQGLLKILPLSHGARRATPLHLIVKRDLAPIDEQLATLLALFRRPEWRPRAVYMKFLYFPSDIDPG
jgi:DNA-binding transcriptional LysR family regulator